MGGDTGQEGGMNTIQAMDPNTLEVTQIYEGDFNFKSNSN